MIDAIVVGLGNPGPAYRNNRHNAGSMLVEALLAAWPDGGGAPERRAGKTGGRLLSGKSRFTGEITVGFRQTSVMLCRNHGWLNHAGRYVAPLLRKHPRAALLVCHDDIALPLGTVKVKHGGGSGGHNGVRSIDQAIGNGYARLRIGIGHPGDKALVHDHVLSDFKPSERREFEAVLSYCARSFPRLLEKPVFSTERLGAFLTEWSRLRSPQAAAETKKPETTKTATKAFTVASGTLTKH